MNERLLFLLLACAATPSPHAWGEGPVRAHYFPLVFAAEGKPVRTSGCVSAAIRDTENESWWRPGAAASGSGPADGALLGVLDAIRRKDRAALLAASHGTRGRDPQRFDEQAKALFAQFPALGPATVDYAIGLDEFTVYYLRFGAAGNPLVPFIFEQEEGAWRYLPYRTEALAYQLLQDWVRSPFGPDKGASPTLCSAAEVAKLRHAIPLGAGRPGTVRARLYLNAEMPPVSPRAQWASSAFATLQKALAEQQPDAYAAGLTPEGRKRLLAWHASAKESEREAPRLAMEGMRPLAAFDLAPLTVLVLRGPRQRTETVYFMGADERALMVNSAYITSVDRVFKRSDGPVMPAMRAEAAQIRQWAREP